MVPNLLFQRFIFDTEHSPLFKRKGQLELICFLEEIVFLFDMVSQVSVNLKDKVVRYLVFVGKIKETDRPLHVAIEAINDVGQDLV